MDGFIAKNICFSYVAYVDFWAYFPYSIYIQREIYEKPFK